MGVNQIRVDVLFFLFRNNYWQNRHTPKSNICNKLSQPNHGKDIFLNIHKKSQIEREIKDKLDQLYNWK